MLLTIQAAALEPSLLDYLCEHASDFAQDRVMLLMVDQCVEVQTAYKDGVISVYEYAQKSLQIVDTVRSRPLGLMAIEEYRSNYIEIY